MIVDIESLDPRMQPAVRKYLRRLAEDGIPAMVLEARRSPQVQMAYYSRGRAPAELVKAFFAFCDLWAISDAEVAVSNTKTLYSKHLDGLAVDIAPTKNGKPWWSAPPAVWRQMYIIAEDECGLDACAAGKWNAWQWDWPHHEFRE